MAESHKSNGIDVIYLVVTSGSWICGFVRTVIVVICQEFVDA